MHVRVRACAASLARPLLAARTRLSPPLSRPSRPSRSSRPRPQVLEDEPRYSALYCSVSATLLGALDSAERTRCWRHTLLAQDTFVARVQRAHEAAYGSAGRCEEKQAALRAALANLKVPRSVGWWHDSTQPGSSPMGVPLPLTPSIRVTTVEVGECFLFATTRYPAVLVFRTQPEEAKEAPKAPTAGEEEVEAASEDMVVADGVSESTASAAASALPKPTSAAAGDTPARRHMVIFKRADDLRQDQLVMQLISLMDQLLKHERLDLGFVIYRVLATGRQTGGLIEFVNDCMPVSAVLAQNNNSIVEYLRKFNPDVHNPLGLSASAINNFTNSCAGYCVATYLLGIGDRHLDNIMLMNDGKLFHVDFGHFLGSDPKLYPPPFRLTREMAEVMGFPDGAHYKRFEDICCTTYNCLRRSAPLLLGLLDLMSGADLKSFVGNPQARLKDVRRRFR